MGFLFLTLDGDLIWSWIREQTAREDSMLFVEILLYKSFLRPDLM